MSPSEIRENIKTESDIENKGNLFVTLFKQLFLEIDGQLENLISLEKSKESLGTDGFMPSISMGYSLSRIVS